MQTRHPAAQIGRPERLEREAGVSTPAVRLDPANGSIALSGESYPENSAEFFRPILDWLQAYLAAGGKNVQAELTLSYINTGSIKSLMDLFDIMEDAHLAGRNVSLVWRYEAGNPRALEAAEEFREDVSFPFSISMISE
ncbi:MAG: SiaC family regulatory phosphoprotein [Janthinobacterium lividum]